MNVRIPARRLVRPAVSLPITPHRTFISDLFNSFRRRERDPKKAVADPARQGKSSNPLLDQYMKNKPDTAAIQQARGQQKRGDLSSSSVFQDVETRPSAAQEEKAEAAAKKPGAKPAPPGRDPNVMANVLDPDPRGTARWQRKMVIREVQRRGRVSRTTQLARTEREDRLASPLIKTSVKKLVMLAHQIAGKSLDDAILQMRFSKKKAAKEVQRHLEYARDHAAASRGMGLGEAEGTKGKPVEIELKDGKRKLVEDRTNIYVDQAWVGRGPYKKNYEFRARGRVNVLRIPSTSISVVLKEEATRIRQHKEREEKRANRKVWTQLPDRPIQQQRQHVLW